MRNLERDIGSVRNLVVFEAAARHMSFSKAAAELSVTQPAVSQAVQRLEQALGARLFQRRHRRLALTEAGIRLQADVSDCFDRLSATARQIRRASREDHVTLLVSTAFATWWMVPRLADLHRDLPDTELRLETVDRDIDIARETDTLAVRRGDGIWPGYEAAVIAPEVLWAVAAPNMLTHLCGPTDPVHLCDLPLIHLDEPHRYRPGWADFFAALGHSWHDRGEGLRLNDYALVIQAAQAGEGVALGWEHIVSRPLAQGLLRRVGPWRWRTGSSFYLVWSSAAKLSSKAMATRDWILRTSEVTGGLDTA